MQLDKTALVLLAAGFPLSAPALADVIEGSQDTDTLEGTEADDVIFAMGGDDTVFGGPGNDVIDCGPGNDFAVDVDGGDDRYFGGPGDDLLRPLDGSDVIFGGAGNDLLDLVVTVDFGGDPPCDHAPLAEYDIALGGEGEDVVLWASGVLESDVIPGFDICAASANAQADGGRGWDQLFLGVGDFAAPSEGYVVEGATLEGFSWQVRSLTTAATIQLRNVEEVVFIDGSVILESSE